MEVESKTFMNKKEVGELKYNLAHIYYNVFDIISWISNANVLKISIITEIHKQETGKTFSNYMIT